MRVKNSMLDVDFPVFRSIVCFFVGFFRVVSSPGPAFVCGPHGHLTLFSATLWLEDFIATLHPNSMYQIITSDAKDNFLCTASK